MCIYIRSGKQVERASACEAVNEAELSGTTGKKAGRRKSSRKDSIDMLVSIGHNLDGSDCPCSAVVVCGCELSHCDKREEGCKGSSVRFAKRQGPDVKALPESFRAMPKQRSGTKRRSGVMVDPHLSVPRDDSVYFESLDSLVPGYYTPILSAAWRLHISPVYVPTKYVQTCSKSGRCAVVSDMLS